MNDFKGRHFRGEIVLWAVRWYCRYAVSFDLHEVQAAEDHALALGAIGFDAVKHLVLCRVEKRPPKFDLDVYPYLPRATVGKTSIDLFFLRR